MKRFFLFWAQAKLERGDVPKSIQCYMHEASVSEDVARDHIKGLIRETWKKLNECQLSSPLPQPFISSALNLARVGHYMYDHGDALGDPDSEEKKRIISLYIEPLQVNEAKSISLYAHDGSD